MVSCTKYFVVYKVLSTGRTRRKYLYMEQPETENNKEGLTNKIINDTGKLPETLARDRKNSRNDK